ncbi:MAG: adaptor protein MecA [Oscillospiraceae bacterium]|nr:adaptor protein MecA [Oscillospiraceae bacterium]
MQIDVLSQNTLKLTLSRLDMFDLDIRYESLSGKNPDTKRLLSHVLRTVKLDKSTGIDFSGERLFVEAFPRPDGGCMLYISCLTDEKLKAPEKKPITQIRRLTPKTRLSDIDVPARGILCRFDNLETLKGACAGLSWQLNLGTAQFTSTLYGNGNEYRLYISGETPNSVLSEYGEIIENEFAYTAEHYTLLIPINAVEKLTQIL